MSFTLPLTIEHGGEKLSFLNLYMQDGAEVLEGINEVQPGSGPPMHIHYRQDESFTVVSGKMAYQLAGEKPKYAYPGEHILIKAGIPHKFWNAGDDILVIKGFITPPENFIYFLTEIFRSVKENNGKPGIYDAAYLLKRYKSEYAILDIPKFVQRFLFPVVLFFGNLLGKHKKFAGAPLPVN